jgi:hypothetical protein
MAGGNSDENEASVVESAMSGLKWISPLEKRILRRRLSGYVRTQSRARGDIARVSVLEGLGYAMIGAIVAMTGVILFLVFLVLSVTVWKSNSGSDFTRIVCDIFYVIGWSLIGLGCLRVTQSIRLRRKMIQEH